MTFFPVPRLSFSVKMGNINIVPVVICTLINIFVSQIAADIKYGTTTTYPDSVCPDDWILFGKHCYYISLTGYSQSTGRDYCETHYNSTLVSINSEEEHQFLWENMNSGIYNVWIGLYKESGYDVPYEWTDGSELNYTNWYPGQPDYTGSSAYCVKMYLNSNGEWIDDDCSYANIFACETAYVPAGTSSCSSTQFDCQNGQCLPSSWECDNHNDCTNGNDEKNCGGTGPSACTSNEFDCLNGQCLPSNWKCDGYIQCSNGYDEQNCSGTVTTESPTTEPGGPSCSLPFSKVGDKCLTFEVFLTGTYGEMNYRCSQFGAKPVSIDDANDLYDIVQFIKNNGFASNFWLEGYKPAGNGTYSWRSTGQPVKSGTPFWASIYSSSGDYGQEPSPSSSEQCIFLNSKRNYYFSAISCDDESYGVICEKM